MMIIDMHTSSSESLKGNNKDEKKKDNQLHKKDSSKINSDIKIL